MCGRSHDIWIRSQCTNSPRIVDSFTACNICYVGTCSDEFVEKIVNASKHLIAESVIKFGTLHDTFILVIHKNSG
ncbi:hypothetical protein AT1219_10682 [Vibrio alginolyticus]